MATCENRALNCIYEFVKIAGDLPVDKNHITASKVKTTPHFSICAFTTSSRDIFVFCIKKGKATFKLVPWSNEDCRQPLAFAFSPTSEWLLVAIDDGSICIVPVGSLFKDLTVDGGYRFSMKDVIFLPSNGNRAKPTSIVWWQTLTGDACLGIIGTELGELCFVELTSGKDVGGTYITVPVIDLHLCRDNSLDTVYLLITGTEDRQWRLVLEQKSCSYMFPLESITPEWSEEEDALMSGALVPVVAPSPRSRLMGLKQLSVEKLQLLKQRLSEAKQNTRKKPVTENKGVDTCDIDELPSPSAPIITPQVDQAKSSTEHSITKSASPATETLQPISENEPPTINTTKPEILEKYLPNVLVTPHYAKERYLLGGHHKENSCLMVYSTDIENTPLYVYKLPDDTNRIVLHDELIFVTNYNEPSKISILSTFFSSSSKISGEIDNKIDPFLQELYLPDGEEILEIYSASGSLDEDGDAEEELHIELPTETKPDGIIVITKSALYLCQTRKSIEKIFMELTLRLGDSEAANKMGVIFGLDPKLFELAADAKLKSRCFPTALALYKHSRCPHVKCSLKFAWAGFVPEFLTYMCSITNGVGTADFTLCQRKYLATLAVMAHLHQLSLPAGVRTLVQQQTTLKNLLLFLKSNVYYDEIFTLVIVASTWRWETLQYLTSSKGLLVEKLHALLSQKYSPVISNHMENISDFPMRREKEAGFLHCISDPELRGVLLLKPILARGHMNFVIGHLDSFDVLVLRRLASLYDPTEPAIAPFLSSSAYFQNTDTNGLPHRHSSFLPSVNDDPIGLDTLTQTFLAILVKLNEKRGWKYTPELLDPITVEKLKGPVTNELCAPRKSLSCGYGHSIVNLGGAVYSWGLWNVGILGHGSRCSVPQNILQTIDPSITNEIKELNKMQNPPSSFVFNTCTKEPPLEERNDSDCCNPKVLSYLNNMKVLQVACGKNHCLAITDYGVYGFGSSKYGQLGTGSTGKYPRPTLIAGLLNQSITQVSCGQFHSLAVTSDGNLLTWGWGVHGQLGHRSVEDALKPIPVKYLSKTKIIQAYGGYAHSVALSSKGVVYAWGCGTYGQIGTGRITKILRPTRVPIYNFVTHLAAGYFHNVAVTTDHIVYVWGSNPTCLRVQAQMQRKSRQLKLEEKLHVKMHSYSKEEGDKPSTPPIEEAPISTPLILESAQQLLPKKETNVPEAKTPLSPELVSVNTVPSCDPSELGHLMPKQVEMPEGYGDTKAVAAGNDHTLLLTTHGSLYAWGRNMSGQLGVGNRHESQTPVRILDEANIVEMAVGSNFNLALESQGRLWGWGSNYYSQLGQVNGSTEESQIHADRVFTLRTSKRVIKVPHSIQSNVESPRMIYNLPLIPQTSSANGHQSQNDKINYKKNTILEGIKLSCLEPSCNRMSEQDLLEDKDDGLYGIHTLHSSLTLLHPHYNAKNIDPMLTECSAHQALATLYTLERQHSKAMHHQLCALLKHPWDQDTQTEKTEKPTEESQESQETKYSSRHVEEAVRILDHYLHLQTEESQSGMRGVLQEGIGLWLSHSLPIPQLEDLLLTHLPKTVYPLALLLFGEDSSMASEEKEQKDSLEKATVQVLSRLSTKFCLNLCSSVITHLQSGDATGEQLDALSQLVKLNPGMETQEQKDSKEESKSEGAEGDSNSPYKDLMEKLSANANDAIKLSAKDVSALKGDDSVVGLDESQEKEDSDCVLFTCGHHYTSTEFTEKVLPQLEKSVTTVPGLLGKTARVLLDQYHSDQPQMACPHCVLAHLTIKLTKHNQHT